MQLYPEGSPASSVSPAAPDRLSMEQQPGDKGIALQHAGAGVTVVGGKQLAALPSSADSLALLFCKALSCSVFLLDHSASKSDTNRRHIGLCRWHWSPVLLLHSFQL